ncbi:MAG: polyprenyl synthetase family protein [Bacteroidaceae bacterium]|nr:polyprenyl synthetase family protein [Bacteroidaceae bacterium]
MDQLTEIRRPIEAEMRAYRELFEQTLQTENPLLQLALSHLLKRQGKMMRPMLVLLAARYVGQGGKSTSESEESALTVPRSVLHAAVALELLHTASLVHDDVVDESDRRRGQKSVNALLDNKAAVLVGDFLLSKALYHSAQTGSQQVVTWVAQLGQTLSDGELLQLANLDKTEISEADYYEVIRKKTASLFETCARTGALLAGGGGEVVEQMARFGDAVGMCFQLRDDIMDYDNQHDTGKPSGNDMKEGKLTLPVIYAVLNSGDADLRTLALKVRSGEASDGEISRLVALTHDFGGIRYAEKNMDKFAHNALSLLKGTEASSPVVDALVHYVRFVVGRDI